MATLDLAYRRAWNAAHVAENREYKRKWACNNAPKVRAAKSRRLAASPEKRALYNARKRLARYGLTPETYAELLTHQQEGCAICGKKGRLHIDHNHKTKVVRGVLCENCNRGVGMFQEDPVLMRAAASYVTKTEHLSRLPTLR